VIFAVDIVHDDVFVPRNFQCRQQADVAECAEAFVKSFQELYARSERVFGGLGGVGRLWVLGQIAAWQPARAAAEVPPAVATRWVT
jgi:hypothetical protein